MQNEDALTCVVVMLCGSLHWLDSKFVPSRPLTCKWQASSNAPLATHSAMQLCKADLGIDPTARSCPLAIRPGHGRQALVHPQRCTVHCGCEQQKIKSIGQGACALLPLDLDAASER